MMMANGDLSGIKASTRAQCAARVEPNVDQPPPVTGVSSLAQLRRLDRAAGVLAGPHPRAAPSFRPFLPLFITEMASDQQALDILPASGGGPPPRMQGASVLEAGPVFPGL